MKKLVLAAAIASMLSGAAFAAVNLDAGTGTGGTYANEITISAATNLASGAAADQIATATFGASFAADGVAYVRFALPAGQTFTANPTFTVNDSTAGPATVSIAQGGIGTSVVIFAVAPSAVGANLVGANVGTFTAAGVTMSAKATTTLEYKLFETLTNAANNTLPLKTASANFLSFADAIAITAGTAATRTADVASTGGAYRKFLGASTLESLNSFTVTHTARALITGAASTAAAILANTNSVAITGDFTARVNPVAPAVVPNGVQLSTAAACNAGLIDATTVTNTSATFSAITSATLVTGAPLYVCYTVNGTSQIVASSYTGTVDVVGNAGFSPADGSTGTASVVRNGTVLKAAFSEASTVSGTASAVSLTNTSATDAPFTVRCLNSGAATTGTPGSVPANSSGRFAIVSALGCPAGVRGLELTFAVPTGSVVGSVVRQNLTTGVASFDGMVGNQ